MKVFAELIRTLDSTNKTNAKVAALAQYFESAPDQDKVWTIAILSHRRPPRPVNTRLLREWAAELAHIPMWLFEESYHIVGDLAETIALIVPSQNHAPVPDKSLSEYLEDMIRLRKTDEVGKKNIPAQRVGAIAVLSSICTHQTYDRWLSNRNQPEIDDAGTGPGYRTGRRSAGPQTHGAMGSGKNHF